MSSDSSRVAIMHVYLQELTLATGRRVHGAAGDCSQVARLIAPINTQYHQYIQGILLRRESLQCRPCKRAETINSIRVGHRHGDRKNCRKVVTGVIYWPARVSSPGNIQTGCVGLFPRQTIQTERFATDGERWSSTHPPPWLLQSAGKLPMSASFTC